MALEGHDNRIPIIMALSRFLMLEPKDYRAAEAFSLLLEKMNENIKKNNEDTFTVYLNPQKKENNDEENDFHVVDMALSLSAVRDYLEKNKKKNEIELFAQNFESMCECLKEQKPNNKGFFWEYYAPYFIEMKDRKYITTFAYMIFCFSRDEKYIRDWVKNNIDKIGEVIKWSDNYKWPKL